jgi:SAM-dependent methyltransferase
MCPPSASSAEIDKARIGARIRDLQAFSGFISSVRIRRYLDFGCGNGVITAGIGALLGLEKDGIIGTDVSQWAGHSHAAETSRDITFIPLGDSQKLDLADASIDLITIFMVLHHVPTDDLSVTMAEIARVLSPDGLVIIREHDSPNEYVDRLINIEHALFETIIEGLVPIPDFQRNYRATYKPRRDWTELFAAYGFVTVGTPVIKSAPTRPFYQAFRRQTGATTIDMKTTTDLMADVRRLGIPVAKSTKTSDDQLKRAILAGRRGQT